MTALSLIGVAVTAAMAVVGLPPWDLHTPLHHAGIMDPACGGTRAIRLAAMGQWGESIRYNPLGLLVLLVFGAFLVRAAIGLATSRWYTPAVAWTRRRRWMVVSVAVSLVVALEVRQQAIAPLLMAR